GLALGEGLAGGVAHRVCRGSGDPATFAQVVFWDAYDLGDDEAQEPGVVRRLTRPPTQVQEVQFFALPGDAVFSQRQHRAVARHLAVNCRLLPLLLQAAVRRCRVHQRLVDGVDATVEALG